MERITLRRPRKRTVNSSSRQRTVKAMAPLSFHAERGAAGDLDVVTALVFREGEGVALERLARELGRGLLALTATPCS
jgi:hypothetical protein